MCICELIKVKYLFISVLRFIIVISLSLMLKNFEMLTRGGFLIRRSSAIRRFFAGFVRCDSRTIIKSFLKKITREFIGNLHKNRMTFPENSRAIFFEKRLHYCTTSAPQKSCESQSCV